MRTVFLLLQLSAALTLVTGCNAVLDNEPRTLAQRRDAGTARDAGDDAGPGGSDAGDAAIGGQDGGDGGGPMAERCPSLEILRECAAGTTDPLMQPCGWCGLGKQSRERTCSEACRWSEWSAWGECELPPEACEEGKVEMRTEPCGPCNVGLETSMRTCTSSCGWSEWSEGTCVVPEDRCEPATTKDLEPMTCDAMCGKATPRQTCNASCEWDAPVLGACTGEGTCLPGETRNSEAGCNPSFCFKGVQQQVEVCSDQCTWGPPTAVGACAIPANACRPADLGGQGWRCRASDPGFREFCTASSASEEDRCTWDNTRERYGEGCGSPNRN